MHSDKIKLRRFAMQLYFAGDARRSRRLRRRERGADFVKLLVPALRA